jgi:DNA-binding CsgD family transcriptional regulator
VNATLAARDARLLQATLDELVDAAPASAADIAGVVINGRLSRLVGCDLAIVAVPGLAFASDPAAAASRSSDTFEALSPEHPIIRHRARTGALGALTFDDVTDRRLFVRGEVFNELFAPYGWNHTLNVRVTRDGMCDVSFGRLHQSFGGRERLIADLARTCLQALWTRPRKGRPRGPLTERQSEILEMVADGLTNREIADRLYLAPGTVKRHLDNIYRILDVHTRTAAARFAERT